MLWHTAERVPWSCALVWDTMAMSLAGGPIQMVACSLVPAALAHYWVETAQTPAFALGSLPLWLATFVMIRCAWPDAVGSRVGL